MAQFPLNKRVAYGGIALSRGVSGWDSGGVSGPGPVLKIGPGDYRMWYEGQDPSTSPSTNRTGYATSADGISWTKSGSNPIFSPSGAAENNEASFDSVFFDVNDNAWRAYYHGGNNSGGTFGRALFYATSPDIVNGGTWTRGNSGNPVLQKGSSGAWDDSLIADAKIIQVAAADYRMWYHGQSVSTGKGQIGYATSSDGITWAKSGSNPVLTNSASTWEDGIFVAFPLMLSATEFHMWYLGDNGSGQGSCGYASSSDGIAWAKSSLNPVGGYVATGGFSDSIHMWQESDSLLMGIYGAFTVTGSVGDKRIMTVHPARTP